MKIVKVFWEKFQNPIEKKMVLEYNVKWVKFEVFVEFYRDIKNEYKRRQERKQISSCFIKK